VGIVANPRPSFISNSVIEPVDFLQFVIRWEANVTHQAFETHPGFAGIHIFVSEIQVAVHLEGIFLERRANPAAFGF